jgi:hypothetical protein
MEIDLLENVDFDLQDTCQSHYLYEHMKWPRSHCGHVAPDSFPYNHDESSAFDKSVEIYFFKGTGFMFETIFHTVEQLLGQIR